MAAPYEVLFTTEASGQLWNTCAWDLHSATSLITYKGSSAGSRTLCVIGGEYLLTAVNNKPLIHVWALQRKDQMQLKIVCPGRVSALACSPDGHFCVAGITEKIHVWQVSTGNLLAVLTKHYQHINCIQFTDDCSHFITAGEDNLVFVWSLASVLCPSSAGGSTEPRYIWSQHSLPVTDLHVGCGGIRARVATASLDQTVKLWELCSGQMLLSIVFENSITSIAMDSAEHRLFAGASNGNIYQVDLFEKPVQVARHIADSKENTPIFTSHSKQVSCLSVSTDGRLLASGSHDTTVKLWDISSRQCIRTIPHKGVVTNTEIMLMPPNMLNADSKPTLPIAQFKRHIQQPGQDSACGDSEGERDRVPVRLKKRRDLPDLKDDGLQQNAGDILHCQGTEGEKAQVVQAQLQEQINKLKIINKQIYSYAVKEITKATGS